MSNIQDEDDNLETYTPVLGERESVELDESTTSYSPRLNRLKEGDKIEVKLNEEVIKWRIAHDLYKDYRSGVRELFQNEARACRQARAKYNAKPKIVVTINAGDRRLSIQGIDSLGISEVVFDKVLRVLGVSGNTDGGEEVGQFGMGFASYVTLSNVVIVDTWYRENRSDGSEQIYSFMGDKGIDFKILPEPELETYGTKLSLTFNANCKPLSIIHMIKDCSRLCGVPTDIIVEDDFDTYDRFGKQGIYHMPIYNGLKDFGRKTFNEVLVKEDLYNEDGEPNQDKEDSISLYKEVHIDNNDYEFFGVMAVRSDKKGTWHGLIRNGKECIKLLARVPIDMNFYPKAEFTVAILNIKNERKFMPTADRDRLTEEANNKIQHMYEGEIGNHFKDICVTTIQEYETSLYKPLLECFSAIEDVVPEKEGEMTREVLSMLNYYFSTPSSNVRLSSILASKRPAIALKALKGDYMQRLSTVFDEPVFFRFNRHACRNEDRFATLTELLRDTRIIFGEEYIKKHKLKPLTKTDRVKNDKVVFAEKPIRLFNSGFRRHHVTDDQPDRLFGQGTNYGKTYISTTIGKVNENVHDYMIIVPTNKFKDVSNFMWRTETKYVIMKNIKGLDLEKIKTYDDWLKDIGKRTVTLMSGKELKLETIIKSDEEYKMTFGKKEEIIESIGNHELPDEYKNVIYAETREEDFEISCYLQTKGKRVNEVPSYELQRMLTDILGLDLNLYCNEQQKRMIYIAVGSLKDKLDEDLFNIMCMALEEHPYDLDSIVEKTKRIQERLN